MWGDPSLALLLGMSVEGGVAAFSFGQKLSHLAGPLGVLIGALLLAARFLNLSDFWEIVKVGPRPGVPNKREEG